MFRLIGGLGGKLQRDGGKQAGVADRMVHRSSFKWELRGFYGKEGRLKTQTSVFRRPASDKTNKIHQTLADKKMLPPGGVPNGNYLSKVAKIDIRN